MGEGTECHHVAVSPRIVGSSSRGQPVFDGRTLSSYTLMRNNSHLFCGHCKSQENKNKNTFFFFFLEMARVFVILRQPVVGRLVLLCGVS